jgi:hypothetical protein
MRPILFIFLMAAILNQPSPLLAQSPNGDLKAGRGSKNQQPFFNRLNHLSLSFTNTHTAMPFDRFAGLLYKEVHPGFEIGTGLNWSSKKNHDWIQSFKAGYSYHQFIQHSITLYTEAGYRHRFPKGFAITAKLGVGYLHAIEDSKVMVLKTDGTYAEREQMGRSQGMATITFGFHKQFGKQGPIIFLDYQQRAQFSFITAYVPVLPANSMIIGFGLPINKM